MACRLMKALRVCSPAVTRRSGFLCPRAAVLVLLQIASAPSFAASPSPDGERLAFSFIGGPESIFVARADGSAGSALVEREVRDFRPEWEITAPLPTNLGDYACELIATIVL